MPYGYRLTAAPYPAEIEKEIVAAGFTDKQTLGYKFVSGNWSVEKLK